MSRSECGVIVNSKTGECCGKPAVYSEPRRWSLCAEHYDIWDKGDFVEVRDKDRRP
jgi:hypothetical protein